MKGTKSSGLYVSLISEVHCTVIRLSVATLVGSDRSTRAVTTQCAVVGHRHPNDPL